MNALRRALCIALCCVTSLAAQAIPDAARGYAESWRTQGRGEMRWFGFRLYAAELWVGAAATTGTTATTARFDPDQVFALKLTYARDFSADRLVSTSIEEMQRLGNVDAAQARRWQSDLTRVFPDVKQGEVITGVYLPGRGAAFFHQGKLTGELTDPVLAKSFFNIWLDPRTRAPELRSQLLGLRE